MPKKTITLLIIILLTEACTPYCGFITKEDHSVNDIAAKVNDTVILKKDIDDLSHRAIMRLKNSDISLEVKQDMRASILRKMIDDEIIKQKLDKERLGPDRIERVEALENYITKMGGKKRYLYFLDQQNLTEEQMKKSILQDLYRDKLISKHIDEPTEDDITTYFANNKLMFSTPDLLNARHILLKFTANESSDKEKLIIKKAQNIIEEFNNGANFIDLVAKYSEGPSAKHGGSLGFFAKGTMVKEFEDIAFSAPLKQAVGPVKTKFGYHIIYVESKTLGSIPPLEKIKDQVKEAVIRQRNALRIEEMLSSLRQTAKIDIKDSSLSLAQYMSAKD